MNKTYIPGKDCALEDSIAQFQSKLAALNFNIEPVSWLNPVPNVWSVHIRDNDAPMNFTNGKGASEKAALASALGEYFERLACNYFYADFYLGETVANSDFVHYPNEKWFKLPENDNVPAELLDERLWDFYQADEELAASLLIDLQSSNDERGICALPFVRQSDNKTVYIPVNIIGNLYVSNGMSAGNSQSEAHTQALSEIFERAVKNRVITERIALPQIPEEVMQQHPAMQEAIAALEAEGFPVMVYDASLGGKYPVVCVALFNPNNNTCFTSWGAHPRFAVALERTVTELLQGRSLKDLDVFEAPSFDDASVADHHNLETHFIDSSGIISWDLFKSTPDLPFCAWDFVGNSQEEAQWLLQKLYQEGTDAYISDLTHLGVHCCRIIVPGWSEIYPPEELTLCNNNRGHSLRLAMQELLANEYSDEACEALFDLLDDSNFDDSLSVCELMGISVPAGSAWKSLTIGELKGLIGLAAGDLHSAQEFIQWCLEYNSATYGQERLQFLRCLQASLQLALDETRNPQQYQDAFAKLYGQAIMDAAWDSIRNEIRFFGLVAPENDLTAFAPHKMLLKSYQKLQIAKQTNANSCGG